MVDSWKIILFSKSEHDDGLTLTVEVAPGTMRPIYIEPSSILEQWNSLSAASGERRLFLERIVKNCQATYPHGAGFGRCLYVRGSFEIEAVFEDIHPDLLPSLPVVEDVLSRSESCPAVVSMSELQNSSQTPRSLTYQTSLVVFQGQLYIAKGPTEPASITDVFSEVAALSSLPKHPSIIGPPPYLVSVSKHDSRLIGYLLEYYPSGNVRDYAIANSQQQKLPPLELLCKWSSQIARVLRYLLYECKFTYVDIKPDKFLVDNNGDLVLADFSEDGCTGWIAAPEMFHGYSINVSTDGKKFWYTRTAPPNNTSVPRQISMPNHWPYEAREKAMVYSVGRSMWMTFEAIPADKFTMSWRNQTDEFFNVNHVLFTKRTDDVPQDIKDMILQCVQDDPNDRPTLSDIETFFKDKITRIIETKRSS